jgi:transcription elongation factor GreB
VSKAFTKEDGAGEAPLVPPRAPLPPGVPNYVTPRGLELLRAERRELERARDAQSGDGAPGAASSDDRSFDDRAFDDHSFSDGAARAQALGAFAARLRELDLRIASAECIDAAAQPKDSVRFGAKVTLEDADGRTRSYEIVGVDEADPAAGRIAFTAPLARALLGASVGDEVSVTTPGKPRRLEIVSIE